jgi:hypothetical protein
MGSKISGKIPIGFANFTMNSRLVTSLKFNPSDLPYNQEGRLSPAQRKQFAPPKLSPLALYVVLGHAVLLVGVFGGIAIVVNQPIMWFILLIVGALGLMPFGMMRNEGVGRPLLQQDLSSGVVEKVCGKINIKFDGKKYHLLIDTIEFNNVTRKIAGGFTHEKDYCVYYLPKSKTILSAESLL